MIQYRHVTYGKDDAFPETDTHHEKGQSIERHCNASRTIIRPCQPLKGLIRPLKGLIMVDKAL
jgi:hypothetical protein